MDSLQTEMSQKEKFSWGLGIVLLMFGLFFLTIAIMFAIVHHLSYILFALTLISMLGGSYLLSQASAITKARCQEDIYLINVDSDRRLREFLLQIAINYNLEVEYLEDVKEADDQEHWENVKAIGQNGLERCQQLEKLLDSLKPQSIEKQLVEFLKVGYQQYSQLEDYADLINFEPLDFDQLTKLTGEMMGE